MTVNNKLNLLYGICADDLSDQLKCQGFDLGLDRLSQINRLNEAINMLYMHDILTDNQTTVARKRLQKKITVIIQDSFNKGEQ